MHTLEQGVLREGDGLVENEPEPGDETDGFIGHQNLELLKGRGSSVPQASS